MTDVLAAIRHGRDGGDLSYDRIPGPDGIDDILAAFETAAATAISGQSLKDLALAADKAKG